MMRCTIPSQRKRMLAIVPLLAALFALLPFMAAAAPHRVVHVSAHHHEGHVASALATHARHASAPRLLRSHLRQFKAHTVASRQMRHMPGAAHHSVHAILHARTLHPLVRRTFGRDPLARHLAPNAPPTDYGSIVSSLQFSARTVCPLRGCLLRPCLGRAPPVLL